jgi:rRNA processing protein Gar1
MSEDFDLKLKRQEAGITDKKTGQANAPYTKLAESTKKVAKATKIGKIALGVVGAGLAAKAYLKSKMSDKKDSKESMKEDDVYVMPNTSKKAKPDSKMAGGMMKYSKGSMVVAKGNKLARSKPTKLY